MPLPRFFQRLFAVRDETPYQVYGAVVAQARRPDFYCGLGVPDTLDGRFDMIVLHAYLLFARLKRSDAEAEFAQRVFDVMFADMDRSLREMGVGDLSVPKKIRKMAEAFYGRVQAYEAAAGSGDEAALAQALGRNLFPDEAAPPACAGALARYMMRARERLAAQSFAAIATSGPAFPEPVG